MNWYWHVRIYDKEGHYWHGQIITGRDLKEIGGIQDFYGLLTGCRMLIEGMSEQENPNISGIQDAFEGLWSSKTTQMIGKRTIQTMTAASSAGLRLGNVAAVGSQISARVNAAEVGVIPTPNTRR